jgi:hypothetical protein
MQSFSIARSTIHEATHKITRAYNGVKELFCLNDLNAAQDASHEICYDML